MAGETPQLRSTTGRRLLAAFAGVLLLFAAALGVELVTLRRIADAEGDVERLDHAKHAGHMAAAQVRDQYIHQAHTLIEFGPAHLEHYAHVRDATRQSIAHLDGARGHDGGSRARSRKRPSSSAYREMLERVRERATRDYLVALMRDVVGNVTQAADRAGIERESMHRLLKKHGVRSDDFKAKG